ncbi:MAG: hypothetical protein JWL95_3262 [Gemmatimonadetes bacterium]|nr:hypothetical protein [Gemmatimonadota bacterium]
MANQPKNTHGETPREAAKRLRMLAEQVETRFNPGGAPVLGRQGLLHDLAEMRDIMTWLETGAR